MKLFRVKFYKREVTNNGNEKSTYLGYVDVNDAKVADDMSLTAKAFRMASLEQRDANSVTIIEL